MLDVSKDIRSLTEVKRETTKFVNELKETDRAVGGPLPLEPFTQPCDEDHALVEHGDGGLCSYETRL